MAIVEERGQREVGFRERRGLDVLGDLRLKVADRIETGKMERRGMGCHFGLDGVEPEWIAVLFEQAIALAHGPLVVGGRSGV